jgi:hypothetical protein
MTVFDEGEVSKRGGGSQEYSKDDRKEIEAHSGAQI